ncbi:unnamed protein product [Calypogeia fissa]
MESKMEKRGLLDENNNPIRNDRRRFFRTLGCQFWSLALVLAWIVVLCCVRKGNQRKVQQTNPLFAAVQLPDAPSTLQGPFQPRTVPFNESLGFGSEELNETNPRVVRRVTGWEPEQISLALSTPDAMYISWITGEAQIGFSIAPLDPSTVAPVVQYGTKSGELSLNAVGTSEIYNQLYPYQELQNYTSGIIHHVKISGLEPNSQYFYRVGDPSIPALSKELSFRTLSVPGPASFPTSIAVIGDLGLTYNSTSTIDHLMQNNPDLVFMIGDMVYADLYITNGSGSSSYSESFPNTPIHETYQPRWDLWGRFMEPLTSAVPLMVIEGNHEIEGQGDGVTFASYKARFSVPFRESGSPNPFYYSFDAGGIHFLMLGAYIDYSKTSEQYAWIERDLAQVNRSVTPWLVATWHPPWYNSYVAHYREVECMRISMEELLYKNGVDLVLNGHVHAYERMNRVYNYTLDECGPVHIIVGDGGNHEKFSLPHADEPNQCPKHPEKGGDDIGGYCGFRFDSGPAAGQYCWDRQPEWSAMRETSFGHGIINVMNSTHLLWTWHRNQDLFNGVGDQVYIVRQPGVCHNQPQA